jgi:selenocysteine lyase/cysteine desulfurase
MRPTRLYLDTARLGQMSPSAQRAHLDFVRLAGDEAASPFFEHFLRDGTDSWGTSSHRQYPGLSAWRGVGELKRPLRRLAGTDPDLPVLLAARSSQLVKLAARLLFHPCRNVLVTDLCWPPYREALESEARRADRVLTAVAVGESVREGRYDAEEVARHVVAEAVSAGCDGVFLSAVGHLGYRLPVESIARNLAAERGLRIVVVDGAQEFCHVSADLSGEYCDLYLAGCHKWLGAHHPLGLGFYRRRRSVPVIETLLAHLVATGEIDDPLLRFTGQLETRALDGETETVNLAPLFSCQGALCDALAAPSNPADRLSGRLANLEATAEAASMASWAPLLADPALRSGILLLRAEREETREAAPEQVREAFGREGIALTAYREGLVRVSMPDDPWGPGDLDCLAAAFRKIA